MAIYIARAVIDSHMCGVAANQNTNYGTVVGIEHGEVYVGDKTKLRRPIGNFHVHAVAGRTINSAKLVRYITGFSNGGFAATLYRCTRPSTWTEAGVTWNKYDGANAWTVAGGDYDAGLPGGTVTPVGFVEAVGGGIDEIAGLLEFVTDAISNRSNIVSLILRADDESPGATAWVAWHAKEASQYPGEAWRLVIDHDGPPIGRSGAALGSTQPGIY